MKDGGVLFQFPHSPLSLHPTSARFVCLSLSKSDQHSIYRFAIVVPLLLSSLQPVLMSVGPVASKPPPGLSDSAPSQAYPFHNMSTRPIDLILEHSCIFSGPQRRLSWHQDSLICSPDYYTLAAPDAYEPLLLHRVPSPSLCLDEMLELWPVQDKPSSSPNLNSSVSRANACRDSLATLVDFGSWVSRQSHDRLSSLLPPAPHWDRPDLNTSSDSVECRLLSPEAAPAGELDGGHWPSCAAPYSKRSTTPDQLGKLCAALENSSLISKIASQVSTRTNTPVPSLSHSHCSVSTCSAVDTVSPESVAENKDKMSQEHWHMGHDGSAQRATTGRGTSGVQDPKPQAWSYRLDKTWSALQVPSVHQREDLSSSLNAADLARRPGDLGLRPMPGHNALPASFSDPGSHASNPEISYIDWDDDEEEGGQHQSRLARMKKSLTDLRNAERFISESVGRGNGMSKGHAGRLWNSQFDRSIINTGANNTTAMSLQPLHNRSQGLGKTHGQMVVVNNLGDFRHLKQDTMDTSHAQILCRTASYRERPAMRLRKHASSKSLSTMESDCPLPWSSQEAKHGSRSSIGQSMRHKRRTISSQLEGFTPLRCIDYTARVGSGAGDDGQSLRATPMMPLPMDGAKRRISSMMLRGRMIRTEKAKGTDKGHKRGGEFGRWARMLCGRGCGHT